MKHVKITLAYNITEEDFKKDQFQDSYRFMKNEAAKELKEEWMHDLKVNIQVK
jgi:hypothetical protein